MHIGTEVCKWRNVPGYSVTEIQCDLVAKSNKILGMSTQIQLVPALFNITVQRNMLKWRKVPEVVHTTFATGLQVDWF